MNWADLIMPTTTACKRPQTDGEGLGDEGDPGIQSVLPSVALLATSEPVSGIPVSQEI